MGDLLIPMPEIQSITLQQEHEFLILASDGLWDVISSKEAVAYVRYMHYIALSRTSVYLSVLYCTVYFM
jgi:serine/threonine protein phosphatase PrpC